MRKRFIPTHVGNAWRASIPRRLTPVHPHARGERAPDQFKIVADRGSSPRTWGTPGLFNSKDGNIRFIPTHVGNA